MMKNGFNGADLAEATCGRWNTVLPAEFRLDRVVTDTREDCSGAIFLALRGENFDAHDFLDSAVEAGAAALCINEALAWKVNQDWNIPVLMVRDTLTAYQNIAHFHRKRLKKLRAVAITGSMGKTSCKEIIRSILIAAFGQGAVYATRDNTNNQVGVPKNLLNVNSEHRFCVLEMGTNHFGEIEPLSRTLEPDVALINSIAPCHLEALGDIHGVAREKSRIFSALNPDGVAVLPLECPEIDYLLKQTEKFKTMRFGREVEVIYHGGNLHGSKIELAFSDYPEKIMLDWSLSGAHQASNAAAAATVALALGVEREAIAQGLRDCFLPGMRMKTAEIDGVNWINDAYNASPESVMAALKWLEEFVRAEDLVLVLGDMLELGVSSINQHRNILKEAFKIFPEAAYILIGSELKTAAEGIDLPEKCYFHNKSDDAGDSLKILVNAGKTVLLKGSRGIKLENLCPDEDN